MSTLNKNFIQRRANKKLIAEINVVPYIDVMLVLLVIFMITAPLLTQGVEIELPRTQAQALTSDEREPLIASVDAEGQYFLNVDARAEQPIAPMALMNRVAAELQLAEQQGQQRAVLVRGDQGVDYGRVVTLMVLLQQAGASQIGLVTQGEEARDLLQQLKPNE